MNEKKKGKMIAVWILSLVMIGSISKVTFAEGSKELTANGGYRPYTERNGLTTVNRKRRSQFKIYMNAGEKLYVASSIKDAKLYNTSTNFLYKNSDMGTNFTEDQLKYINSAEMCVRTPDWNEEYNEDGNPYVNNVRDTSIQLIDITGNAGDTTNPGYIGTRAQEKAGPNVGSTTTGYEVNETNSLGTKSTGLGLAEDIKTDANVFTATKSGVYTFIAFSDVMSGENPKPYSVESDTAFTKEAQDGSTIAAWDASVYSAEGVEQKGRVFSDTLFLNMGNNINTTSTTEANYESVLNSKVYVLTNDGYKYLIDFNGMDPFGFIFFANARGLLNQDAQGNLTSLSHSVKSNDNAMDDFLVHNIILNAIPKDETIDQTYKIFFNEPTTETMNALGIKEAGTPSGTISNFKFVGTGDTHTDEGYTGSGGDFTFDVPNDITATSFEINLNFGEGNDVVLSNNIGKGATNKIHWDGKNSKGEVVPVGTYDTSNIALKLKGGEIHFPLIDVEHSLNGIKVTRLNGQGTDVQKRMVYYNNSASNTGDATGEWSIDKNWKVANQLDKAVTGEDSSTGAMKYADGDYCALDIWANYNRNINLNEYEFKLVDKEVTTETTTTEATTTEATTTETTTTEATTTEATTTENTEQDENGESEEEDSNQSEVDEADEDDVAETSDQAAVGDVAALAVAALGIAIVTLYVKKRR